MKNTTKALAATLAIAFSGSALAGSYSDRQNDDILYGKGVDASSPSQSYDGVSSRPQDFSDDLLYNTDKAQPSADHVPYERVENDRDNSQDLLYS